MKCSTHRLAPSVLALALCIPGAAYPLSLEQLLRLPLEHLLRLQITSMRSVGAAVGAEQHGR